METDRLIIGGGAAGTFAALLLAAAGKHCVILEKNGQIGRKLRITGKGRCNLTNDCDLDAMLSHIPRNPKFLYSAFSRCMPRDVMQFFEQLGVPLKVERGNRVFPVSDKAEDIVAAIQRALRNAEIPVYRETVTKLLLEDGRCKGVQTASGKQYFANSVLLATGGASYPATGSTGDGYALAKQAGHTIQPPLPALVPLEIQEDWCSELADLSLRNISLRLYNGKKCLYDALGEMQFTRFGVTGPLVLTASSLLPENIPTDGSCRLILNCKPGLTPEQLDRRIQRDCAAHPNQAMGTLFRGLLPFKLVPVFLQVAGIPPETKANALTKEQRQTLVQCLQAFPLHITARRSMKEAIITRGGVSVKEVQAKTMASKCCDGLYFAGELLDVDAFTGGFNLQIAFSTAFCVAEAM
jgi:predicted Rossmann fold flavoprotein